MQARRRRVVAVSWPLRAAIGGKLRGFAGVVAWREPGQVRCAEATVGPDRICDTQRRFQVRRCVAASPPTSSSSRSRPAIRFAPAQWPGLVAAALPEGSQLTLDHLRAGC
jgi:hypothetical protein